MATRPRARDQKRAALERLEIFSAFGDAELTALAQLAQLRRYGKGRTLVVQGAVTETTFGIVSGRLRVSLGRANGSEATLAILGPGELVGELGLFQDGSRSAHVTALEDACVLTVGKSVFLSALERSPGASLALCRLLASRVRLLARHFEEVTAMPVEQRLARKLVFLAGRWGEPSARCWHQSQALPTGAGSVGRHESAERQQVPHEMAQVRNFSVIDAPGGHPRRRRFAALRGDVLNVHVPKVGDRQDAHRLERPKRTLSPFSR